MMRVLYQLRAAVHFADTSMEAVFYYAYHASTGLADERGGYLEHDLSASMGWPPLRERIKQFGMPNLNCVAIDATTTISDIVDVSGCIDRAGFQYYVIPL